MELVVLKQWSSYIGIILMLKQDLSLLEYKFTQKVRSFFYSTCTGSIFHNFKVKRTYIYYLGQRFIWQWGYPVGTTFTSGVSVGGYASCFSTFCSVHLQSSSPHRCQAVPCRKPTGDWRDSGWFFFFSTFIIHVCIIHVFDIEIYLSKADLTPRKDDEIL